MTKQPFEHNCTKETPRESLFPCSRRPTLSASDFSVRSSLPYKAAHNIRPFNHKANGTVQCPLFEAIPQLCLDEFWSLLSLLRLCRPQFPPASWPAFIGVRLKIIQDDNVVKNINGYFYYTVLAHLYRFCIVYLVAGIRSFHLQLETVRHVLAHHLRFTYSGLLAAVVHVARSDALVSKQIAHNFVALSHLLSFEVP